MDPDGAPMRIDADRDTLIRGYLLGDLPEEDMERVETQLLTDDDFFQQIELIEDELVDAYLGQELSAPDVERFENTFLRAPERRHKLRFARALHRYAAGVTRGAAEAASGERERLSSWRMLLPTHWPRPALAYSLAAALIVIAAGAPWMLQQINRMQAEISEFRARQEDTAAEEARRRARLEEELAAARRAAGRVQREGDTRDTAPLAVAVHPWFTLSPGLQRSAQAAPRIGIPAGALLVTLKLDLPENPANSYRAVLSSGGREILSRSRLKALASETEIVVSLVVPASELPDGHCEIRLYGPEEGEPVETFSFRVVRN